MRKLRAVIPPLTSVSLGVLLRRFRRDESGGYLIISALLMPALVGFVGLGTETGLWFYKHQAMQGAADSGAISAATAAYNISSVNWTLQANAVTSSYGFVNGTNGTTVTVNNGPTSGNYVGDKTAFEVIVQQPQARLFSALWVSSPTLVKARAVARFNDGLDCVLSLDRTASGATTVQGTANVNLTKCSLYDNSNAASALTMNGGGQISAASVDAVGGISSTSGITAQNIQQNTGSPAVDPYANVPNPSPTGTVNTSCDKTGSCPSGTLSPGIYNYGMDIKGTVTLSPGIYYIEGGGLTVEAGAVLTGNNVTLVLTQNTSNSVLKINGNSTVSLTAPTTGATAGIVIFGDRTQSGKSLTFNGGGQERLTGAIYAPTASVQYGGGANDPNSCTQLIADTVTFTGTAYFALNCQGDGTKPIGTVVKLVE